MLVTTYSQVALRLVITSPSADNMRHPRFPEAYGIIVAIARFIGAVTAIANMVLAAMLAARASPRRGASSAIAVVVSLADY